MSRQEIIDKLKQTTMKNFKTNLAGLAVLLLLGLYFFNLITTEHFVTATAFLVTIGFFAAGDAKKE